MIAPYSHLGVDMTAYTVPEFNFSVVKHAGKILAKSNFIKLDDDLMQALQIALNWRASHAYPMLAFYVTLQRRARKISQQAEVAQRLKRFPSILRKLNDPNHNIGLTQMQDIGGCRAILPSLDHVRLLEKMYKTSKWEHQYLKPKDYIKYPKDSGYRSIHLIYKFCGNRNKSPSPYNGLKIEIQIRTKLQHIWATAVEAADIFTGQALKWSGGREEWRRFFAIMGSVFALREKSPLVPNTPLTLDEMRTELKRLNKEHHIVRTFESYRAITKYVIANRKDATYFLLTLDPIHQRVDVKGFKKEDFKQADKEYAEAEKKVAPESGNQVVLVSVKSVSGLKRAYPNYFLDTEGFLREVELLVRG